MSLLPRGGYLLTAVRTISKYFDQAISLRNYLKQSITLEQSKAMVLSRTRNRARTFLSLVEKAVYGNSSSPYLKLLKLAGCELGDIRAMVERSGIEDSLKTLKESGFYLDWEEFKGKKEVTRGSARFQIRERDLDNPSISGPIWSKTSGTQSHGTRTKFDLNHQLASSYYRLLMLAANNALDYPVGMWQPMLPSIAGLSPLMHYSIIGKPIARWFSPVTEKQIKAPLESRLAMRYIIYAGRAYGGRLPGPEYVPFSNAAKVASWMAESKKKYGSCALESFVSSAVKVCQAAMENNLDIAGTRFFVGGEPLTEAKYRHIRAAGANVSPRYFNTELGSLGFACPGAREIDEIHLFHDSLAIIPRDDPAVPGNSSVLLLTGFLPTVPKIMINVECGDQAVIGTRDCSCLFGELGLNTVLHHIRSFDKLTGGGMTILAWDLVHIVEEVLPAKYGGSPADYQFLEEEDTAGHTRLVLVVSPQVNAFEEKSAIDTTLSELRSSAHGGKLAAGFWSQLSTIQIRRAEPVSVSGKISAFAQSENKNLKPGR
jgi:hypothetical protein